MRKLLGLAAGSLLAAVAAPSLAQAQNAYTTDYVNLRAGPGMDYPVVFEVAQGQPLESYGCLDGYSWCDVSVNGYRGWMAGDFIQYAYNGGYVPLYTYGPRYHVPIISFVFGSYWDTHYRHYNWYRHRDSWAHYDWRRSRWDNDNWRRWADNNRRDWDRDGRRDGRNDRDGRDWRNGRNDRNGGASTPWDDWRRQARNNQPGRWDRNDGDNNGRNGQWDGNGRNNRFDGDRNNDRRPGSPVLRGGTNNANNGGSDPSVHSGDTDNRNNGTRFGNPQRWGNNAYKPDSVTYGNQNRRIDTDRGTKRFDNQSNTRIDRNVVTPKVDAPRVDAPKSITPRVDRSNDAPKFDRSNRGGDNDRKVDRSSRNDKSNDGGGKGNKRDRDGRS